MTPRKAVRFTFQSCADLNSIWETLATPTDIWAAAASNGVAGATEFSKSLEQVCDILAQYPEIGSDRSDVHPGVRSMIFQRYALFYRLRGDCVEVIRVFGGSGFVKFAASS
jgi:plasmid stabilization system protein ParE